MANPNNPFNLVFDAIWALFESSSEFEALVKPGNKIKYNLAENRDTIKQTVTTADLPEVALVNSGFNINLFDSSSSTKVVARYSLIANTGDFRLNKLMNDLNWIVLVNLKDWRTVLTALTWHGASFVKRVGIVDLTVGESNPDRNRQIKGWVSVWQIEIEMHFQTSTLTYAEPSP